MPGEELIVGVECRGLCDGFFEVGIAVGSQWTPSSCPSLVLVAEVRDCASCPFGHRHALFMAKPSKERTERARVALACVWMQLLKLRREEDTRHCAVRLYTRNGGGDQNDTRKRKK